MFEIDENTRYSLRILGRGSVILVSVALILAIIGYFKRDEDERATADNTKSTVFEAEKLYKAGDRLNGELMNKKITVKGVADSLYADQGKTVLLFAQENEKSVLKCYFRKSDFPFPGEPGQEALKIEGLSRGTLGSSILMERCKIQK